MRNLGGGATDKARDNELYVSLGDLSTSCKVNTSDDRQGFSLPGLFMNRFIEIIAD